MQIFQVGLSYGVGAGVSAGYNSRDRSLAAKVTTPVGSFGAKVGCKLEVCIFACVTVKFC